MGQLAQTNQSRCRMNQPNKSFEPRDLMSGNTSTPNTLQAPTCRPAGSLWMADKATWSSCLQRIQNQAHMHQTEPTSLMHCSTGPASKPLVQTALDKTKSQNDEYMMSKISTQMFVMTITMIDD
jgi:hypothetical protein